MTGFGVASPYRMAGVPDATGGLGASGRLAEIGGQTMGTHWRVRCAGQWLGRLEGALPELEALFDRLIDLMSQWREGSWLDRYNGSPAGSRHTVPAELECLLDRALEVAEQTGGAFDPAIGALIECWGFGAAPRRTRPPEPAVLVAAQQRGGWRRLREAWQARFGSGGAQLHQPGGLALDLSGIGKGHAVDLLAGRLTEFGIADCLVEIGGEWVARGHRPDGAAWRVGIDGLRPDLNGRPFAIALSDAAIATSGDAWQVFEHQGRRFGHLIDPRSGWPASSRIRSVSVVAPDCATADALATALYVLGPDQGMAHAEAFDIAAVFVMGDDAPALRSPAFERLLRLTA